MGEDTSRALEGSTPQVLAALRNLVIFLVSLVALPNESRPQVLDRMAARPPEALQALDLPNSNKGTTLGGLLGIADRS